MATFTTTTSDVADALVSHGVDEARARQIAQDVSGTVTQGDISPGARARLWYALVYTLAVILVICTIGVLWSVFDGKETTNSDVIVTLFTATLTGLLGLFVKSPSQS